MWAYQKESGLHMKKASRFEEMLDVFSGYPLTKDDYEEFYVDTSKIRSVFDASNQIVSSFRYCTNPYSKLLFMGHKGSGKSTEMVNISKKLEDKYEIISFSVAHEVELNGLQYIDVIFTVMSQIIEYLDENPYVKVDEKTLKDMEKYWRSETVFESIMGDSTEASVGGKVGLSALKAISVYGKGVLKTGSETKTTIRQVIEPKIGYLIDMINRVLGEVNAQLREKYGKELLVIIEDLDKLDSLDARKIFVDHRKTLMALQLKMIFSFPIYLEYTPDFAMIQDDFDVCVLYSMIKVRDKGKDGAPYQDGINILKEIVYRRMEEGLIEEKALEHLIMMSGGAIRDLFAMLKDTAFLKLSSGDNEEPIGMREARIATQNLESKYERYLSSEEHFERLAKVYEDPVPRSTDPILSDLLKTLCVIEYNGSRWCGVHPVLIDFLKEKNRI